MTTTVEKGRTAEAKVVAWLVQHGYEVFLPMFGNATCDLIVLVDGKPVRVETKYVAERSGGTRRSYEISLRQTRANRAVMISKRFNAEQCDLLAVYFAPLDRVGFYAAAALEGRTSLCVRPEDVREGLPGAEDAGVEPAEV